MGQHSISSNCKLNVAIIVAILMSLSDRQIRNAKPKTSVYRIRDGAVETKGFGVTVAPAGTKTFFLGYTSPETGKRTQISLGRYPAISLKEARRKAMDARDQIGLGIDPAQKRIEEVAANEALKQRGTVEQLFEVYTADLDMDGKRSAGEVRRIFRKHVAPVIGDRLAADTTTDDILDVITPIVRRGSTVHADNVRAYLRAAFEFAIHAKNNTRWRKRIPNFDLVYNPVAGTKRATRRKPVGTRSLSREEVKAVWRLGGLSPSSHLAVKLLIATGQRVEEVLQASWGEFDLEERLWTIPAARRKTRHHATEPHIVPLTAFHIELLNEVQTSVGHDRWLFPHEDKQQPRKADALYQAVYRFCAKNGITSFAPRDCRRTVKTLTGSIGISLELRNRLQGHAMTDIGSIHYDRWEYLPEKRAAMELWTEWLQSLV